MNQQLLPQGNRGRVIAYILSPDEERVMQSIAQLYGEVRNRNDIMRLGFNVPAERLSQATGLEEIRLRSTLEMLKEKRLLSLTIRGKPTHATLTKEGDRYVVEMEYVR